MKPKQHRVLKMGLSLFVLLCASGAWAEPRVPLKAEKGFDMNQVEQGRYLTRIAGCNDCHTPGYAPSEGTVTEDVWLTGDSFGWRGAWGTTYGSNLRLFVNTLTEQQWITTAHNLKARPPMPWFNLKDMNDQDLQAIYQFIKYLGPAGAPAPAFVPPGQEPSTPYALFPPPPQ